MTESYLGSLRPPGEDAEGFFFQTVNCMIFQKKYLLPG
jgi:hypothetical protein